MRAASVPCGQVRSVGQALRSPEARERGLVSRVPHAQHGWLPNIASPIRYSATPLADPMAAPGIGQHTAEILRNTLGYSEQRIAELVAAGAVGAAAA